MIWLSDTSRPAERQRRNGGEKKKEKKVRTAYCVCTGWMSHRRACCLVNDSGRDRCAGRGGNEAVCTPCTGAWVLELYFFKKGGFETEADGTGRGSERTPVTDPNGEGMPCESGFGESRRCWPLPPPQKKEEGYCPLPAFSISIPNVSDIEIRGWFLVLTWYCPTTGRPCDRLRLVASRLTVLFSGQQRSH